MARRRQTDPGFEAFKALVMLIVAGGLLGWFTVAKEFVTDRLPLFVALGAAVVVLLVLVLRRLALAARERRRCQAILDAQVATTDGMTGPDFERLVARLMTRDGFTDVRIPGGSGDLGADVMGRSPAGVTVVVQCKRYAEKRSVSSPDMQKFLGTCFHEHGADEAWFVTTTRFSAAARDLGARRGVRLVDRTALAEWMAASAAAGAGTTAQILPSA